MIHLKTVLDKRYQRKDGTFQIVFRLSYMGQSRDISTGLTCKFSDWDSRYNCLKPTAKGYENLELRLRDKRLRYQEKLLEFERSIQDSGTSVNDIKKYLVGELSRQTTVREFWLKQIEVLKKTNRHGNARAYQHTLKAIEKTKDLNIEFSRLNYKWVNSLDIDMRCRGLKPNGLAVYMRTLRAIYNKAINIGIADQENYPFNKYIIKSEKTAPRVASIDELSNYFKLNVEEDDWMFNHWNFGKLVFLLRGINFVDLALLTQDNIKQNRIVYKRRKTHKLYSIEILPEVERLIHYYHQETRDTLFPILSNEELKDSSSHPYRIGQLRKTTNKWLKKLGKQAGIGEPLSSYVFRYSFANACKKLGYSKDLIAEALGHEYGNHITGIYLEQYDLELVDAMNLDVYRKVVDV